MTEVEVITDFQKRRKYTPEEKEMIVKETLEPENTVATIANKYEVAPNVLYCWRRKYADANNLVLQRKGSRKAFAEVIFPNQVVAKSMKLEVGKGVNLHIPPDMAIQELATLLKALKG